MDVALPQCYDHHRGAEIDPFAAFQFLSRDAVSGFRPPFPDAPEQGGECIGACCQTCRFQRQGFRIESESGISEWPQSEMAEPFLSTDRWLCSFGWRTDDHVSTSTRYQLRIASSSAGSGSITPWGHLPSVSRDGIVRNSKLPSSACLSFHSEQAQCQLGQVCGKWPKRRVSGHLATPGHGGTTGYVAHEVMFL
jgi:hypothetical protein